MNPLISALYVHFPFCEAKCHYCDFYSMGKTHVCPEDPKKFESALKKEAAIVSHQLAPALESIFFGGGTPSLTSAEAMSYALEPFLLERRITRQTEWTLEANPSSIDLQRLKDYRSLGINRISMGVQALCPELLTWLGRVHTRETALRSLNAIFEAGFENVSIDLLCGVPGQTLDNLGDAIKILTAYPITHLSCYLLTLPKHHPLFSELPDDKIQLEHLLFIDKCMRSHGFEHYEISNYAKPGMRSRHNLSYWKGQSYLGLGPSAHSFDTNQRERWKNVSSLHKYITLLSEDRSPIEWTEQLTESQRELEKWMLALRLNEGFPYAWLKTTQQQAHARALKEDGLLEHNPNMSGYLRLTARGMALSDQVILLIS